MDKFVVVFWNGDEVDFWLGNDPEKAEEVYNEKAGQGDGAILAKPIQLTMKIGYQEEE